MSPTQRKPEIDLVSGPDFFDDFPEQWLGFGSVEEEILRGAGLRLHKPDYRVTCDNVVYEMPIATGVEKKKKKKYSKRPDAIQTTPNSPRPCSPSSFCRNSPCPTVANLGSGSGSLVHHYWSKKCPLRIAELAQPTKRQCIENMKQNAHKLPPFMLERLRQRINDDRPLAEIPDAINCFKIKRPPQRPRTPRSMKQWKTVCNNYQLQRQNLNAMETRNLCTIFGHAILTKLAAPKIITLNPELQKLSRVVETDLTRVMKCKKLINNTNDSDCQKIRKEIADKVTAWIVTVLEESKDKLVEEEVKVASKVNYVLKGDEDVNTLIQTQLDVSSVSFETRKEMEEEIGPVLDFVDDLVNTVMGSVDMEENDTDSFMETLGSDTGGSPKSKYDTANSDDDTVDTDKTKKPIASAYDFYSKTPPIENENVNVNDEDEVGSTNMNDDDANGSNEPDENGVTVDASEPTQQNDVEINAEPEEVKNRKSVGSVVTSSMFVDNFIEGKAKTNKKQTKISTDANEIIGILQKEGSVDDTNRTVKFSNVDIVIGEPTPKPNESTTTFTKLKDFIFVPAKKHSAYDSYPLDSALAPPNEHLLSDADELWPEDIATPGITINSSVTQSITSLGKIIESDQELAYEIEDVKELTEKAMFVTDFHTVIGHDKYGFESDGNKNENLKSSGSDNKIDTVLNKEKQEKLKQKVEVAETIPQQHRTKAKKTQVVELAPIEKVHIEKVKSSGSDNKIDTVLNKEKEEKIKQKVEVAEIIPQQYRTKAKKTQVVELAPIDKVNIEKVKTKEDAAQQNDLDGFEKCKGDHKDVNKKNLADKESKEHHTPDKFEYRVNLETAPTWARVFTTDDSNDPFKDRSKNEISDVEIRKWCKDLDSAYEGLEQWSIWIKAACKEVIELKEKFEEIKKPCAQHYCQRRAKEWSRLKKDIDKDTLLWTKLYQRAHGTLIAYTEKQKQKNLPKLEDMHTCTDGLISVFDSVDTLHFKTSQLIDSTEQWLVCSCRKNSKKRAPTDMPR